MRFAFAQPFFRGVIHNNEAVISHTGDTAFGGGVSLEDTNAVITGNTTIYWNSADGRILTGTGTATPYC